MRSHQSARRCAFILFFTAAFGLLAAARTASAQDGSWTTRGPLGGNVYCLVPDPSHPSTLYAGTDQGVFKSEDGGASWRTASDGLSNIRVQTIAIDPTTTATLYAGTITPPGVESVGIFKSTDAGASWTPINDGLYDPLTGIQPLDVASLAVDPKNPSTIIAGSQFSEIFKSTDGGASWQFKTFGGFNIQLQTSAIQFDPTTSSKIYAASNWGLIRSTDGGESWSFYGNSGLSFFSLVFEPNSSTTLYAGNFTSGSGIFKSTDSGAHWTSIDKGLPANQGATGALPLVIALAVDPARPTTVYAGTYGNGLFLSTDGGSSWAPTNSGLRSAYVAAFAFPSGQSSPVFAGTLGGGVYQSLDTGRTWTPSNANLVLSLVNALAADSASPDTLYAAAFDGVQKTTDGGGTWQGVNNGLPVAPVAALLSQPGTPRTLFAGTRGGGLLKTTDGGATWSPSAQGLSDSFVASLTADPTNPSILYAGTAHPYNGSNSERVFKSTDGGATWTQTSLDAKGFPINFLAVNRARPSQVAAISMGTIGYYQSLDAGNTWTTVATDALCGAVNAVLFDPSGSTIYLAGSTGVCRSTDGGKTWITSAVATLSEAETFLIDPSDPSALYVGAAPAVPGGTGGVFRSADGGATWQAVGTGLSAASVTSIVIDSLGKTMHAGTNGNGVAELALPRQRQAIQRPPSSGREPRTLHPR